MFICPIFSFFAQIPAKSKEIPIRLSMSTASLGASPSIHLKALLFLRAASLCCYGCRITYLLLCNWSRTQNHLLILTLCGIQKENNHVCLYFNRTFPNCERPQSITDNKTPGGNKCVYFPFSQKLFFFFFIWHSCLLLRFFELISIDVTVALKSTRHSHSLSNRDRRLQHLSMRGDLTRTAESCVNVYHVLIPQPASHVRMSPCRTPSVIICYSNSIGAPKWPGKRKSA